MASNRTEPMGYVPGLLPGMLLLFAAALWIGLLSAFNAVILALVGRQFWGADQVLAARSWLAPLAFVMALVEVVVYETVKWAVRKRRRRLAVEREPDYRGWQHLWEDRISDPRTDGKPAEPMPDRLDNWDGVVSSAP